MMRKLITGLSLLFLPACASMQPPYALAGPADLVRPVAATPAAVARAALPVFAELGIPIATQDATAGLVQGAEVTLRGDWGDKLVRDRIYCGKAADSGIEYAFSYPVAFTLGVVAAPVAGGSDVRISFVGSTQSARGRYVAGVAQQQCSLAAAFAQELLGRIAAKVAQP
jgi:hypothetical protein